MKRWLHIPRRGPALVVGGAGGALLKSFNGTTWSSCAVIADATIRGIFRSGSTWYVAGSNGKTWQATDGDTFTHIGTAPNSVNGMFFNGSYFLLRSNAINGRYYKTSDCINFTSFTIAGFTDQVNKMHWNGSLWAAVAANGQVKSSADGENWTAITPTAGPYGISGMGLHWFNSLWLSSGPAGATGVQSSPDLVTWTDRLNSGANDILAFADNGTTCIVVGGTGLIYSSTDGTSWTSRTSGTSESLFAACWDASLGRFYVVGNNGAILSSPDGTTWTVETSGSSDNLSRAAG